jgi:hypothetical protein
MDGARFDALVSSCTLASRRRVLKWTAASVAAMLLASRDAEKSSAKCVKPGGRCRKRNGDKHRSKAKKCCGGARCDQKKCICEGGPSSICAGICCIPGQVCAPIAGVPTCVNGSKAVGDDCSSFFHGACATGNCGCLVPGSGCTCRQADCLPLGGDCSAGSTAQCCQGKCVSDIADTCAYQ